MKPRALAGGLVYSTDGGRMCPTCRLPLAQCACRAADASRVLGDGRVRITREKSGRGGKEVTVERGLAVDAAGLDKLGKKLKAACGTGGTVKDGAIELQGDHRDKAARWLEAAGHPVKVVR